MRACVCVCVCVFARVFVTSVCLYVRAWFFMSLLAVVGLPPETTNDVKKMTFVHPVTSPNFSFCRARLPLP